MNKEADRTLLHLPSTFRIAFRQVDVPIHVHNGDTAIITFTGVGYDKRIMGDTMPMTDQQDLTGVPGIQSVPVPGQVKVFNLHIKALQ